MAPPGNTLARARRDESVLLVVDIQERLARHVAGHEGLVARTQALVAIAKLCAIPRRLTEHCPNQLGPVIEPVRERFAPDEIFVKTCFGAADHPEFVRELARLNRRAIVLAGMEAHVCVMQTALGLIEQGFAVFPVVDAIGSRGSRSADRLLALERLRERGAILAGTETVLFEWAQAGDDPRFRPILEAVKSLP